MIDIEGGLAPGDVMATVPFGVFVPELIEDLFVVLVMEDCSKIVDIEGVKSNKGEWPETSDIESIWFGLYNKKCN